MKSKEPFLSDVAPVRRAMEAWRKTRKHRQPIPEALWAQMAALARAYGVSPVAQALRLDYYHLKRRATGASESQAPGRPGFVELKFPPNAHGTVGCVAELEDGRGRKLTLRWGTTPGAELLGVVRAFWTQGT